MNRIVPIVPLAFLAVFACAPAAQTPAKAQDKMGNMGNMHMDMVMPAEGDAVSTRGYKMAMATMMDKMPMFSGNADTDFMKQMRGHHQSAIDMAEVELANGADPEAKLLAQKIIADQKAEIEQIDAWLSKKGA